MSDDNVTQFVPALIATIRIRVNQALVLGSTEDLWEMRRQLAVLPTNLRLASEQKIEVDLLMSRVKDALAKHMNREA